MITNKEIAQHFQLLGQLMELHGENSFKARSYENSAFRIKKMDQPLAAMSSTERSALPGIGSSIDKAISELQINGKLKALEALLEKTPSGVVDMLRLKGIGAKKVGIIWQELGVESLGELLYACRENRLALLKGFGQKTQEQLISNIEFLQNQQGLFHYATVERAAAPVLLALQAISDRAEPSGALRRCDIVLDRMEFVVQDSPEFRLALPKWPESEWQNEPFPEYLSDVSGELLRATNPDGIPVYLYCCEALQFERVWFRSTGSRDHLDLLPKSCNDDAGDEAAIYQSGGLDFIPPELRQGRKEVEQALRHQLPNLLEYDDIRGAVHNHSTWSDGGATLEAMARACIGMGLEYLVISDHSRTAVYAGGLSIERVMQQAEEVARLNQLLAPFRIFHSIESDILADGSLDYPDDVLEQFDLVIASIHSGLKMDEEKATNRLLQAIRNPYTTILGHMTGRLLLSRPGYPVDHEAILAACAEHRVVLELNANPWRLDVDWTWIPRAVETGVLISVNPDAHSIGGLQDIRYGVLAARKGGLTAANTWNTMTGARVERWLAEHRAFRLASSA